MSIVKDQLEDLLASMHIKYNKIQELGYDNFEIECNGAEKMAETLQNENFDASYDDEGDVVIVHFTGGDDLEDDEKSIRKMHTYMLRNKRQIKAQIKAKALRNLKRKGLI